MSGQHADSLQVPVKRVLESKARFPLPRYFVSARTTTQRHFRAIYASRLCLATCATITVPFYRRKKAA